ncbi:MAG: ECF-type sigma factor [Planctomycetota bacterium]|jgi:RNA polymerase sigma factor (TIGR02999 family)
MGDISAEQVTRLLEEARSGRNGADGQLLNLVYGELRRIAGAQMARLPASHTLQPTALVNEAYLRLFRDRDVPWPDRAHFFRAAARSMRDVVVEHARQRASLKRGGNRQRITLDEAAVCVDTHADDPVALDEAPRRSPPRRWTDTGATRDRGYAWS